MDNNIENNCNEFKDKEVKKSLIIKLYLLSFLGAIILTGIICWINLDEILFWAVHLFPSGILLLFHPDPDDAEDVVIIGTVLYVICFSCALCFRKNRMFYIILAIWICLLLMNIAGCARATHLPMRM